MSWRHVSYALDVIDMFTLICEVMFLGLEINSIGGC